MVYPQTLSGGTTAHRYFSCYPTEDEAFLNAIESTDKIALLVDNKRNHIYELRRLKTHSGTPRESQLHAHTLAAASKRRLNHHRKANPVGLKDLSPSQKQVPSSPESPAHRLPASYFALQTYYPADWHHLRR